MKALVLKNPGEAVIQLVPDLVRVPDQVLLRVRNVEFCGTDLSSFRGTNSLITYPRILGHEVAATVVEESSLRPDLIQGTNVMVSPYASCGNCPSCRRNGPNGCQFNQTMGVQRDGALTEFIQVPVDKVFPADLSIMDLCMVEPLTVGFHAVARGRVAAEDTVAVIGCGGVGLGAVAGASFRKDCTIAIDVDATKRFYQDHGSARLKTGRGEYPGMLTPVKHTSSVRIRPSLFPIGQMVPFSLVTILFFLWGCRT